VTFNRRRGEKIPAMLGDGSSRRSMSDRRPPLSKFEQACILPASARNAFWIDRDEFRPTNAGRVRRLCNRSGPVWM